jgi:hypothetical protein
LTFKFRASAGAKNKGAAHGITGLRERKHLILLATLLLAGVMEPVITDWRERTRVLAAAMIVVINLGVFFVIFDQRWERWLAFLLVALVLATGIAHQTEPNWVQFAAIAYHALAVLFFGFAVAVILKRIFQQETIRTDAVIGAICGYLLAAAAWGNAYALIYLVGLRLAQAIKQHRPDAK